MTVTHDARPTTEADAVARFERWLNDHWDPDLTVGEWWELLGTNGWSNPLLPAEAYGHGLSRDEALRVQRAIRRAGALGPPPGLGLMLAAPTIATHGTPEQIERFLPDIVCGRAAWCQLFSEPGAGSDLAGLTTRAERDGDVWHVTGQKVWTSGGHLADRGMLLARTDPSAPKHRGITWFAIDMHQPGVEVRPLKEMTGATMFSEVFLTDAVVDDDCRIGPVNAGWQVANTTLAWERAAMGAGGDRPPVGPKGPALPGTVADMLARRAGDHAAGPRRRAAATDAARRSSPVQGLVTLARDAGVLDDPVVRQDLMRLHTLHELTRFTTARHKSVRAAGGDIPGIANFSKLRMADIVRLTRDLGLRLLGARGTLHAYDDAGRAALAALDGDPTPSLTTAQALGAQALPIYGGTDQIQRNLVAERALGLPKEPGDLSSLPFDQLPKNA